MGKSQSFNEYAMIQSALTETRRKIEAREESNERTKEKLLAEEDAVKRGKLLEQIENEKKNIEREKKLLKSLEEKAEKTAKKGNLSEEDRHKAQKMADKGKENRATEKNEPQKTETGSAKTKDDANKKAGDIKERKGTSEKERNEDRKDDKNSFRKKNKPDLSLQLADARERLHIAEDHFKNSLNTQTHNAFVRTRKEE